MGFADLKKKRDDYLLSNAEATCRLQGGTIGLQL